MEEKPYKALIGIDLDGTLLNDAKIITPETARVLRLAIGKGYLCVPETGRPLAGITPEFMTMEGVRYAVTANGCELYEITDFENKEWKCLLRKPMNAEAAHVIVDIANEYGAIADVFTDGDGHIRASDRPGIPALGLSEGMTAYLMDTKIFVPDLHELIDGCADRIVKITVNFPLTEEGLHRKAIAQVLMKEVPAVKVVSGAAFNLEMSREGTGKGAGLLDLADRLGIDRQYTVAIGDSENDMDMIQKAGFSIAMGNSDRCVLDAADYVTASNNEDGVAKGILHYMKIRGEYVPSEG